MSIFRPQSPAVIKGDISVLTADDIPYIQDLIRAYTRQHLHVDWQTIPDMLREPEFVGAVVRDRRVPHTVLGAMIHRSVQASDPPVAWLRLALPYYQNRPDPGLERLWAPLKEELVHQGVQRVALLVFEPWLERHAIEWGFSRINTVITLRRSKPHIPETTTLTGVHIRNVERDDIDVVALLDAQAFEPIWQLNGAALIDAHHQAATFTVAEIDHQIVGYQLSTWHLDSGHLARLAVSPKLKGRRIGEQMVAQMLQFFAEREVFTVTVNTQADNTSSQRLYERLGFQPIHHSVPVWALTFDM